MGLFIISMGCGMSEFDLIERYFAPLSRDGLINDGAVIDIPQGFQLVVSSDTLNEGMHFWQNEEPEFIAMKALRSNLSDLLAMGADPLCYQLNLALPDKDQDWLVRFSDALKEEQQDFGIYLSGGDTTKIDGYLSLSITAFGLVPEGEAIARGGAKIGDAIIATGQIGDAWLGLQVLRGELKSNDDAYFVERYRIPQPPIGASKIVRTMTNAGLDISDGLIADLGHMARRSGVGITVQADAVPLSPQAQKLIDHGVVTLEDLITGGDDYQLALAVPADKTSGFIESAQDLGVQASVIGACHEHDAGQVSLVDTDGQLMKLSKAGWQHF